MTKKQINTTDNIVVRGARVHNLKNISINIPKDKLIVISGLSGSGKSSLAFDTLFAEGQRRYIESLSSYARQFLGKLQKPEVDEILGICPAIAIEQKTITNNPRSTIGTSTEIYDYLKLLFARVGKTISPISGKQVKRQQVSDVVDFITKQKKEEIVILTANYKGKENNSILSTLRKQGFSRVIHQGQVTKIKDLLKDEIKVSDNNIQVVIDRLIIDKTDIKGRIADSAQTAFLKGNGECNVLIQQENHHFSNKFELDGIQFEKPSTHFFAFNNSYGACRKCEGFGSILGIDKKKVIINERLSVYQGVVSCWKGGKLSKWKDRFIIRSAKFNFPVHRPYNELTKEEKVILWNGKGKCKGIQQFFQKLDSQKYKIQNRVLIARYRGKTDCDECDGSRLRKDALYVQVAGKSIANIVKMNIEQALLFFKNIKLDTNNSKIADRLTQEITSRLHYLNEVGLSYLTLDRESNTLSGGESQKINLATSIGSSLVGAMYILDEPSIGLHSMDTKRLIKILKELRDIGNTVIVVEHDEEIMEQADQIIDIGPEAGIHGGEIIFQGKLKDIYKEKKSLTTQYLAGKLVIPVPKKRRSTKDRIIIDRINKHNLRNISVEFPLNGLTLVTGMSGSGKSTLVRDILKPALNTHFGDFSKANKNYENISVSTKNLTKLEFIEQNSIGKSSRSNPATYIKVYDDIRKLFTRQPLSETRKYKIGFFSFNIDGGRCEHCKGEGETTVEMQFMADVHLKCEHCEGKRFKKEILEIKVGDKNISDILNLSVYEAIEFFENNNETSIARKLKPLQDVGLNYIKLGQSSNTLSGGESQRIKLASFLGKGNTPEKTLFIFDEPTTGLHFHDINKLLNSFYALIEKGHSIVCIEHNLDVIKCADWIIDLGPEGGDKGGYIVFTGTPEEIVNCKESITGQFLKKKL
ncbi:MAG: excinuclease ABC subunit UvrA [Flavobacteriales bacterium]|jgi:excinuclease ABC subunit A|nr:excinuclease ABC subunit UvrA [Flavobacteriales bacterium]